MLGQRAGREVGKDEECKFAIPAKLQHLDLQSRSGKLKDSGVWDQSVRIYS